MSQTNQMATVLQRYEADFTLKAEDYTSYVGLGGVEELKWLAEPLQGKAWANVNSTFTGGGVAEMLRSVIPLARGLGIDARWYAISGSEDFFRVTKSLHNLLQGVECPISVGDICSVYREASREKARFAWIDADVIEVHDPQPLATIASSEARGHLLWRSHIDTSAPNRALWHFLLSYVNRYEGAIFTMPEFAGPGLRVPVYQITPCIDPRAEKNRQYSELEALSILDPLFTKHGVDPERPVLAAISRYDVHKNQGTILKAFQRLREERSYAPAPYLIFLGNMANDDPESGEVLARLRAQAGDDPDVLFWNENNDRLVGALMRIARGFVHIPTREGFGLVVSEALWQGTPVIGSRVGGVRGQIVEGQTGYLVDPLDLEAIAGRMARLLDRPEETSFLGTQGREHVRRWFLLPVLLRSYLHLLRFLMGVSPEPPEFRLSVRGRPRAIRVAGSRAA